MDNDLRSIQEARNAVEAAAATRDAWSRLDQAATDSIVEAMAAMALRHAESLARLAVEETGCGRVESKVQKNRFCADEHARFLRGLRTVGCIRRGEEKRVYEYADPVGVVAAVIPMTNPTSTVIYKALIALKARNPIVFSPHPRAVRCITETAKLLADAAVGAGAPRGSIQWLEHPTLEATHELMRHRETGVILATGGPGLVHAAYSSGKPAFGVGPGNVPAYVDRSADPDAAARAIVSSQRFDNSLVCASEQSLVIDAPIRDALLAAFEREGAHLCTPDEAEKLGRLVAPDGSLNASIVGQDAYVLAGRAGFRVAENTTVLLADVEGVGREHPLSLEKLAPILSVYTERDWRDACERCYEILRYGGLGHTLAIHARDEAVIWEFFAAKPASRVVVNAPSSQGAVGFATRLDPSMTLGCGAYGNNITSDNITATHLINIKRLAYLSDDFSLDRSAAPSVEYGGAPTIARAAAAGAASSMPASSMPASSMPGADRTTSAPPRRTTPPLHLPDLGGRTADRTSGGY